MFEEQATKERTEKASAMAGQVGTSGLRGQANQAMDCERPARLSLYHRFHSQLERARREGNKAMQLEELVYLMDKHPEVARILELVDALGGN